MSTLLRALAITAAVAALGLVMAYFAGLLHDKLPTDPVPLTDPLAGAATQPVQAVTEPLVVAESATLRARDETLVAARITASVARVPVRPGDRVEAGDLLVELDARDLQARLAQSRQSVAAGEARLAEAQQNFQRVASLYERRTVPRADFDAAQAGLRAAEAQALQAREQVIEAEAAVSYSRIEAPFAGRVVVRHVDPGDTAAAAQPLIGLYDPSSLRVEAFVRESLAGRLRRNQVLQAQIDALDRQVEVTVDEIVPSADPASRTVLVKASLPTTADLFPGMFARLLVPAGETERLYVPRAAVQAVGQLDFVLVREAGTTLRRLVRLGDAGDGERVSVRSGLRAGEQVVLPAG